MHLFITTRRQRPPGIEFENSLLQILPVDKVKCPYVKNDNDIGFWLYTRKNPTTYEELYINDDERLAASHIDFNDRTVVYFHAFLENPEAGSGLMIREAYMLRGDTNVIMVDAQRLEAGPWYFTAAENTWYIGQLAAQFVDYLVSRGLDLSKTHFIGHSLGAQSAGVAGASLQSGRVSRITGLDPAMPLFEKLPLEQKLDASDAEFVDVIHTDAGIFGVHHQIGHADFYPNGGISPQPGCELEVVWPRQQLLQKCDKHAKPEGFFEFHLKPHKPAQTNTKKMSTYFGYSKKERDGKRPVKTIKDNSQSHNAPQHTKKDLSKILTHIDSSEDMEISYQHPKPVYSRRHKRFISLFRQQSEAVESENFLIRMLEFLIKHRKNIVPVVSVVREIHTMVKSSNGELAHTTKERNNYIGTPPPAAPPLSFNLELAKDPPGKAFVKKILGLGSADKLSISNGGAGLFGRK
ncbi:hypothetical protein JYU34_018138 [Plutella xylostella]|uniref:Lipase domain-containing protein n=1 Tax=Plutella xylostella TaxID=51655 RepID=A0ABQ7Q0N4_PLUXY|nr:hypothetical protein JYU34_018138 [Plutella xylostella]